MKYEVWLHARHPKTLETVATVRVYAHDDRLRAEAVLEHAQADFQPLVLALLQVHPGALVNAEMRQQTHDETITFAPDYRNLLVAYMAAVLDAEGVSFTDSYMLTDQEASAIIALLNEACEVINARE